MKLTRIDFVILISILIVAILGLFLPFESQFLPSGENSDLEEYENVISKGFEQPIYFLHWITAFILLLAGFFRGKVTVITLTILFILFFYAVNSAGNWGVPFWPQPMIGSYVTWISWLGCAVYAHFLAFRKI